MNMLWLFCVMSTVPVVWWQTIFVAGVLLFCGGVVVTQRLLRGFLLGGGSAMAFIAAVLLSCYAYGALCCWAQVLHPQSVYAGPSLVYHCIGTIQKAEFVHIGKGQGAWMCVEAQEIKGWLPL